MAIDKLTPELLRRLLPLAAFSDQRLAELAEVCSVEQLPRRGDPLAGRDPAKASCFLLHGELKLSFPDGGVQVLVGSDRHARWPLGYFGDMPVAARAITDIAFVWIDNSYLNTIMTWDQLSPGAEARLMGGKSRQQEARISQAFNLQSLTWGALAQLPAAHIETLLRRFQWLKVKRGDAIVREGEVGEAYYLIESGWCQVTRHVGGVEMPVAELGAGEAFGEEALLAGVERNATVTMRTDGVLLRLDKQDFQALLQEPLLHRIDYTAAQAKVARGEAVWLDVRYPAEFGEDGLPGALNLPLNEVRHALGALEKNREYVVYCRSGRRSSAATFLLAQFGYTAWLLDGGLRGIRSDNDTALEEEA